MTARAPWLLATIALLAGCPPGDPCDRLRDLGASPAGVELTEGEHPGWGRSECLQCHPVWTFHQHDCFAAAEIDVEAIDDLADPLDTSTCVQCHGPNGVADWPVEDTGGAP